MGWTQERAQMQFTFGTVVHVYCPYCLRHERELRLVGLCLYAGSDVLHGECDQCETVVELGKQWVTIFSK